MNWNEEIKNRLKSQDWNKKICKSVLKKKTKKNIFLFSIVVVPLVIICLFSIQLHFEKEEKEFFYAMNEYWSNYYDLEDE